MKSDAFPQSENEGLEIGRHLEAFGKVRKNLPVFVQSGQAIEDQLAEPLSSWISTDAGIKRQSSRRTDGDDLLRGDTRSAGNAWQEQQDYRDD